MTALIKDESTECGCERTNQASFWGVAGAEVSQAAGRVDHQPAGERVK